MQQLCASSLVFSVFEALLLQFCVFLIEGWQPFLCLPLLISASLFSLIFITTLTIASQCLSIPHYHEVPLLTDASFLCSNCPGLLSSAPLCVRIYLSRLSLPCLMPLCVTGRWMGGCKCPTRRVCPMSSIAGCGAGRSYSPTTSCVPSTTVSTPSTLRRRRCASILTTTPR